ncbi:hypothetical protein LY71_102348 [Geodermatophilus tzadiensis]|uniref:Uncharacterized protein n=2 Tax=Geodermatophilus TaxID=1860 RepID=A0A2T0U037_9ACTN|nr:MULTISPECIES: hypothetical protein [Geodermatophilus]PRY51282.1 hypothetical protein LY71_102348 [Geodermatophilus tzadiensis]SDC61048.1 hypothetical protein SAMN05660690_2123 [Geodermatophilus telluris]
MDTRPTSEQERTDTFRRAQLSQLERQTELLTSIHRWVTLGFGVVVLALLLVVYLLVVLAMG